MIPGIEKAQPRPETEPTVRIGVVLAEDGCGALQLDIPDEDYTVGGDGQAVETVRRVTVAAERSSDGVSLRIGGGPQRQAASWRVAQCTARSLTVGAGVRVPDLVVGRGFHWQKNLTQTLTGSLEIFPGKQGLVMVNELPLEDYLAGVITAEMGSDCPSDLLKAQCVVARGWLLAATEKKHVDEPFVRCNDDCCQRYQGTGSLNPAALETVTATRGEVLIAPDDSIMDANYSKCCGGISELPEHVWGVAKSGLTAVVDAPAGSAVRRFFPLDEAQLAEYLTGDWAVSTDVFCSPAVVPPARMGAYLGRVDEPGDYFRWRVSYMRSELEALLRKRMPELAEMAAVSDMRVTRRGVSGRACTVVVDWVDPQGQTRQAELGSEYRIREVLHDRFLYSSAFIMETQRDADGGLTRITLRGGGWGHGAGLCQIGALGMAIKGYGYRDILTHYFPDARIERLYD